METYTVIDFETTGLNPEEDQIIEIGAVKYREDGVNLGKLHTMVKLNAGQKLPKFISNLTGIDEDDLTGGQMELTAISSLMRFMEGTTVIAHNATFELAFINMRCKKYLHDVMYEPAFFCTRAISKLVNPKESARLEHLAKRYNIKINNHHRAIDDAEATWKLFKMWRELTPADVFKTFKNVMVPSYNQKSNEYRPLMYVPENAKIIKMN